MVIALSKIKIQEAKIIELERRRPKGKVVKIGMPLGLLDILDEAVHDSAHMTRSEYVRSALREKLIKDKYIEYV